MPDAIVPSQHHAVIKDIHRLHKVLLAIVIIVGLCVLGGIVSLTMFSGGMMGLTGTHDKAKEKAARSVANSGVVKTGEQRKVESHLGFTVVYDSSLYGASGQVTDAVKSTGSKVYGEEFSDQELEKARAYSIVTIRKKVAKENQIFGSAEATVSTNIRKDFWTNRAADPEYNGMSKLDIVVKYVTEPRLDAQTTISSTEDVKIKGIAYKKVVLSRDNSKNYGIKTPTQDEFYFTIQNDRPYWIRISNITADQAATLYYEALVTSITYSAPHTELLGRASAVTTASTKNVSLPADTSNVPATLDQDTLLGVILKNQPATVRVLTLVCGSVSLQSGAASASFEAACGGGVGSGSFISGDGYVATNGHVVTVTPKALILPSLRSIADVEKLFNYFVQAQIVTSAEATNLLTALKSGNSAAENALANVGDLVDASTISLKNEKTQYGLQLSNQPIRIAPGGTSIEFNDTVVAARLIGKDYDEDNSSKVLQGKAEFTHSDVALLKAKGTFPAVKLGSISGLRTGDTLTAIGFPAYIDGNISTLQWQTVPTITQGEVLRIATDGPSSSRQLVFTNVQIAQGNSGGPSFNTKGEQIGLNTYGNITCPDQKCFGNGTVRDVADLKALIRKHRVTLQSSSVMDDWSKALDSYTAGDYKGALAFFSKVQNEYPANYLVASLSRDARRQLGSDTDISSSTEVLNIVLTVVGLITIAGIAAASILMVHIVRLHKKQALMFPPAPPPAQSL